ncbi:S66 peptidase family protein [Haliangium sp.]|uniref:S66 peptidase family protein n=1 Tax=Haliangium sp. TaxID=2663208 RepID=UPI003D103D61
MTADATIPPALRLGDTVAVCAPAGPVDEHRLRAGVKLLERRYRVRLMPGVLDRAGFLAGSDPARADAFNQALADPDVRAIICARGGYGCMRILADLDAAALRRDPKLVVGFSDVTAILGWALVAAGVRGIHGPMVGQLGELPEQDSDWLLRLMESPAPLPLPEMPLQPLEPAHDLTPVEGRLLGGNLCLLSHLLGTPWQIPLDDALWFFEEIGEAVYRLDRYLTHLGLAGALDRTRVAIVGDMSDCATPEGHPDPFEVIGERLAARGIVGLRGALLAHGRRNLALPFGARAQVVPAPGGARLELREAAVA